MPRTSSRTSSRPSPPSETRRPPRRLAALVTVTDTLGRDAVDREVRVASLEELYDECREAPASKVTRISIRGPEGEVRLNFASFIRRA